MTVQTQETTDHPLLQVRAESCLNLISSIYHINFTRLDSRSNIEEVCSRYHLHPIQYYFNTEVLEMVCQDIRPDTVYHISDAFLVHLFLFSIDGIPFLFGPFTVVSLSEKDAAILLKNCDIRHLPVPKFLSYHNALPVVKESHALNMVTSFIHAVHPQEPAKTIRTITHNGSQDITDTEAEESPYTHQIIVQKRYAHEKDFMEAIRNGNARSALYHLHMMEQDLTYLKRLGNNREKERIGAMINHTVVRITAMETELAPSIIDQLTSQNTRKLLAAKTIDEILYAKEELIRDMCKVIHDMKNSKNSTLIQSALYYMDHHFSEPIRLKDLVDELNISESYLVSRFRKETGITPNIYLLRKRMQRAAILLSEGSLSVSSISSAVGIDDANYFVKLFKKEYGQTPTEYRRSHAI